MPGVLTRFRRSISRFAGRCSCCHGATVDVIPSVRRSPGPKAVRSTPNTVVIEPVQNFVVESDSGEAVNHYHVKTPAILSHNNIGGSSYTAMASYSCTDKIDFVPPNAVPDPEENERSYNPSVMSSTVTVVPGMAKKLSPSIQQQCSYDLQQPNTSAQKSPEPEFANESEEATESEYDADTEGDDCPEPELVDDQTKREMEYDDSTEQDHHAAVAVPQSSLEVVKADQETPRHKAILVFEKFIQYRPMEDWEIRKMLPVFHTVGFRNQYNISSHYIGTQCTVISLTAVVYHHLNHMAFWTYEAVDYVVLSGNYHHHVFRETMTFSRNPDGRIALDELPPYVTLEFGNRDGAVQLLAHVGENSGVLVLHSDHTLGDLNRPFLEDYLEENLEAVDEASYVITVGDFSHGLVKTREGYIFLFDSHGFMSVNEPLFKFPGPEDTSGATLTQFGDIESLMNALRYNHPNADTVCEARPVVVIPDTGTDDTERGHPYQHH